MESVKVVVRCRPMNEREKDLNCREVVTVESTRGQCFIHKPGGGDEPPKQFTFDGAYFADHCTEQIYNEIAYPLVEGVTEGYNGTIFAYGQTGSGKSFSMQGIPDPPSQRGIIPQAFEHIFESIQCAENTKFLVRASYLEIYNEEVRDLLGEDTKQNLEVKEHPEFGVFVRGLSMHTVHSVAECEQIMETGWRNRSVGCTLMNKDSSRSHSIFTISMEICTVDDKGKDSLRAGKLNLVDLAGSERQSKTGATGDRLKEATKINLSLSALGNVISALVDGKCKHIPYRDSKLTRLLQDSLGGNTKTLMVACLSPADNNYDETLSTLRYANRAKNIKNKPRINEDPKDALLREYQEQIKKLKDLLAKQMSGNDVEAMVSERRAMAAAAVEVKVLANPNMEVEKQMIRQEYEEKFVKLKADLEAEQKSRAQLEQHIGILRISYNQQRACLEEDLKRRAEAASSVHTLEDGIPGAFWSPGPAAHSESAETEQKSAQDPEQLRSVIHLPPSANSDHKPDPLQPQVAQHIQSVKRESPESMAAASSAVSHASDATTDSAQLSYILDHQLVLARLALLEQEVEQEVVGGEQVKNKDLKEKRRRRKKCADERKRQLVAALKNMDDESSDQVLLNVYDSIQEELQAKNKLLEKTQRRLQAAEMEINDLQGEFVREKNDYLGTIRKLEQDSKLFRQILEQIQPLIRRDCNYSNLDKIERDAYFDEELGYWKIPDIVVQKTSLPLAGPTLSQAKLGRKASSAENGQNPSEEDRYRQMLSRSDSENIASNYFKSKRASQILSADHMRSLASQSLSQTKLDRKPSSAENGHNPSEEDHYLQILSQSDSTTIVKTCFQSMRASQIVSDIHARRLALQIYAPPFTVPLTSTFSMKTSSMLSDQEVDILWPRRYHLEPLQDTAPSNKSKRKKKKSPLNRDPV